MAFSSVNLYAQQEGDTEESSHRVAVSADAVCLLKVVGDVSLSMGGGGAATEAGEAINTKAENSDSRIRISSLLKNNDKRKITVDINEDPAPKGVKLYVTPAEPNPNFQNIDASVQNKYGTLSEKIELFGDISSKVLVSDIMGICWTGTNEGDGYVLKYEVESSGENFIPTTYTVTYTLVDEN